MKSVLYYGAHNQTNNTNNQVSNYDSMLLLRNDEDHCQEEVTVPKDSFSQDTVPNNFVVAPFPKSVVCTVMPRENKEPNISEHEIAPQNSIYPGNETEVVKLDDWEECSSGEEEAVQIICDKPVICRAVASLPAKFLYFGKEAGPSKGVFAKKEIPKRAQFGPMEGIIQRTPCINKHHIELTIENNGGIEWLDVSNENISNWMKYVRQAESGEEQNLSLHQIGKNLYFRALSRIAPQEELKVWYSMAYAKTRNLPLLSFTKTRKGKKGSKSNLDLLEKENVTVSSSSKALKDVEVSKWRCSHCNKVFRSATTFNLHVLTHAADNLETKENHNNNNQAPSSAVLDSSNVCDKRNKNPLSCYKCKKTFLSNSALACHVKSHASIHTYDCPICKEIFYKVLHLKQHIKSHAVDGNFSCPFCSKKYHEYRHIRNHIRRFHCEKNYGCMQCSKRFSTLDKLKLHMLSHSDHREFTCATCGKQFKRKDKLSVHMRRIHLSLKSKAENTETSINDKTLLAQKGTTAADYSEYIYKCHICMLGFKRRGMLVNHLANRHPEVTPDSVPELNLPILKANRDYYCQYCDKIYKSSSKRKAHILKNHPGKKLPPSNAQISPSKKGVENGTLSQTVGSVTTHPQSCDWCHKQYASKAKLLQHQRKNHLNQLPKSLQHPKKSARTSAEEDSDAIRDAIEKVIETDIFLPETLDISEYEASTGDNKFFSGGEFIIDASTLKRAIKGEVLSADCSPETLSELGQIIDARPDGYFKVYQAPSGITLAHPVEVWDPFQLCLSPETAPVLSSS
ncbi:PR domain zinc finger protein 10 isoform X2 [Halyomorpha halys]